MSSKKTMAASQSTGTKTTRKKASSTPGPKKTSSTRSKTNSTLSKNLESLTTQPKRSIKSQNTSSTKQKKTSTKTSTTSKSSSKSAKPAKTKDQTTSLVYSSDLSLFPYVDTFPYRLEDKSEKKTCYFQTESHARKYIDRYKPEYNLYCYA